MIVAGHDAHHMLGLAWYEYPGSSSVRSWRCKNSFERALKLDPNHQYALQYLAYLAFDQERYRDVLEISKRLEHAYFIERDQEWRALKNEETSLVCKIRLEPDVFPASQFEAFVLWFLDARKREEQDDAVGSYADPQEMGELAEWLFEGGTEISDPLLARILKFLTESGYAEFIWNKKLRELAADSSD